MNDPNIAAGAPRVAPLFLLDTLVSSFQLFVMRLIGVRKKIDRAFAERDAAIRFLDDHYTTEMKAMSDRMNEVYDQRNLLAIALAQLVPGSGVGLDTETKGWDDSWRTVVYLHLPRGQVSFHMSPQHAELAQMNLPTYDGRWDSTFWYEHRPVLVGLIETLGDDIVRKTH